MPIRSSSDIISGVNIELKGMHFSSKKIDAYQGQKFDSFAMGEIPETSPSQPSPTEAVMIAR